MKLTRRGMILGTGAAGGLLLAWSLMPRRFDPPLVAGEGEVAFDTWLKIGQDGVISVALPQLEMGQGISTLIPQVIAHELGADWRQLAVEPAPVSGAYANVALAQHWAGLWMPAFAGLAQGEGDENFIARRWAESAPFMATADGLSLTAYEMPARVAGASARAMLAMAAADRWGVAWEECEARGGFMFHDRQRASFGELAGEAAQFAPPDPPVLRPDPPAERPGEFPAGARLTFTRLDLPAKVDGSATFAGDVRLPGMLHAAIRHAPVGKASLGRFDRKAANAVMGLRQLVAGPDWLAAVGETWWAAEQALKLIAPRFKGSRRVDSGRIGAALDKVLDDEAAIVLVSRGDAAAQLGAKPDLTATYAFAPAHHAGIETASATARLDGGRLELWAASQAPQTLRRAVASALDLAVEAVTLYPVAAGGSFDARLDHAHAVEAALIAREAKAPVQLTWSRWQEQLAQSPRPPVRARIAARTTPDGSPYALHLRLAMPSGAAELGARLFGGEDRPGALAAQGEADPLLVHGFGLAYAIPHLLIEHVPVKLSLPTGRLRGNEQALGCFLVESAVDELARRSGREPLSFRMALLGEDLTLADCLQRAASIAEWNGSAPGSGEGIACHRQRLAGREGRIAVVASATPSETGIRVEKLTAVANIGRIVNADIARQQIEGGLVFGLGLARGCASGWSRGLPDAERLSQLGLPALADCPAIEVEFIESDAEPFDPGELGVAAVIPAISNALFAATGTRIRTLPLTGVGT
jgi:isoquinoline 1-oxidoreductase beta subunit